MSPYLTSGSSMLAGVDMFIKGSASGMNVVRFINGGLILLSSFSSSYYFPIKVIVFSSSL